MALISLKKYFTYGCYMTWFKKIFNSSSYFNIDHNDEYEENDIEEQEEQEEPEEEESLYDKSNAIASVSYYIFPNEEVTVEFGWKQPIDEQTIDIFSRFLFKLHAGKLSTMFKAALISDQEKNPDQAQIVDLILARWNAWHNFIYDVPLIRPTEVGQMNALMSKLQEK